MKEEVTENTMAAQIAHIKNSISYAWIPISGGEDECLKLRDFWRSFAKEQSMTIEEFANSVKLSGSSS